MSIEKQLPLRWFSVPQIVAELKAFTNRQIRTRVAPKRIRNNVTFTNKKYVRFDEHKEKEFNTLKRKLKNIYHETHPAEHLRISFFFEGGKGDFETTFDVSEWDSSIPQNKKLDIDSKDFNKVYVLVSQDNPERINNFESISGGGIIAISVRVLPPITKTKETMRTQRVRDSTQATPSHPFVLTHWTTHGFLPKDEPFYSEGDCLPRAITLALKKGWDAYYSKPKDKLTIEMITRVCGCYPEMSTEQLLPFLQKYALSLYVFDIKGNFTFTYTHPTRNKHRKGVPESIYLLHHNQHMTLLSYELRHSYTQYKLRENASNHYRMGKIETLQVLDDFKGVQDALINHSNTKVYYTGNMKELFRRLRTELNIEPRLKMSDKNVNELQFFHPPLSILALSINLEVMKKLTDSLFIPAFHSTYSSSLKRAFCEYPRGHQRRRFTQTTGYAHFIDMVRCYTGRVLELENIPVFTKLNDFVAYDKSPLEDYTLYIIGQSKSIREYFIAPNNYNLVSGIVLRESGLKFKPLAMCRPSKVVPNTWRVVIKDLYSGHEDVKKGVNMVIGLAAKRYNKRQNIFFTTNETEARHFSWDCYPDEELGGFISREEKECVELDDGYYPFAFMIYDLQRLRSLELYDHLEPQFVIHGIHTDGFHVSPKTPSVSLNLHPKSAPTQFEDIGKLQYEGKKKIPLKMWTEILLCSKPRFRKQTPYEKVSVVSVGTFIEGDIAGAGKTEQALRFIDENALIVVVGRDQEIDMKARSSYKGQTIITYATLIGEVYNKKKLLRTKAAYEFKKHSIILLDEILLVSPSTFENAVHLLQGFPVIATGDVEQNTLGEDYNNMGTRKNLIETHIWRICPKRLLLEHSFRLTNPQDEIRIKAWRDGMRQGASIDTALDLLQTTTDLTQFDLYITFENLSSALIEEGFEQNQLKFVGYDKEKAKIEKLGVPIQKDAEGIHYVLKNGKRRQYLEKRVYNVSHHEFDGVHKVKVGSQYYERHDFKSIHSITGASSQSSTITQPYVIIGWKHYHANWRWLYTALTRCRDLSNVYLYTGDNPDKPFVKNLYRKLEGHREYDALNSYSNDLTISWVKETLKNQGYCCAECDVRLKLNYKPLDLHQYSIDRRDNNLGHLQSNCRITCLSCNHKLAP